MRSLLSLIFILILSKVFGQTISPAVTEIRCPDPASWGYTINLPDDRTKYTITSQVKLSIPQGLQAGSNSKQAQIFINFHDQTATKASFTIKHTQGATTTFTFEYVAAISDRGLIGVPSSVNAPICNTNPISISFEQMRYIKLGGTSSADYYSNPVPYYEYQLPKGWSITSGYIGPSTDPTLVVGTNNVVLKPDAFNGGVIRVRAVNSFCGDSYKKSVWSVININRPQLNLRTGGVESVTMNCGQNGARTFTVENGSLATCASFTWTVNGWWRYNGTLLNPGTSFTGPASITLQPPATDALPADDIQVKVTSGTSSFTDVVGVTFTSNPVPVAMKTAPQSVCNTPVLFEATPVTGYTQLGTFVWSVDNTLIAKVEPDATTSFKAYVTRQNSGVGEVTVKATYTNTGCSGSPFVFSKPFVGLPASSQLKIYSDGPSVCPNVPVDFGAFFENFTACSILRARPSNVEWSITPNPTQIIYNSGNGYCESVNRSGIEVIFPNVQMVYTVKFRLTNGCGTSDWSPPYSVQVMRCSSTFTITPNPANNLVRISTENESGIPKEPIQLVRLVDKTGRVLRVVKNATDATSVLFEINNLRPDTYIVQIYNGQEWKHQKLMIIKK
jgi:hypothetical protein